MAIKAFIAWQRKRITHPDDVPAGPDDKDFKPTVFVLQAVPNSAVNHVRDMAYSSTGVNGMSFSAGIAASATLQAGLADIENLLDPKTGEPVVVALDKVKLPSGVEYMCVAREVLDLIPPDVTNWLTLQLNNFSNLSEDDAKKSGEPS
jgi:hypothetical protein